MEIPNHEAYRVAQARTGEIRHYDSSHPDGSANYEIKCVVLNRLSASAEFTNDVLALLAEKGGPIHSYPAIMPELTRHLLKVPKKFCKEECRPHNRDKALACGKWLGKHSKMGDCNCRQCTRNGGSHYCGDKAGHDKEISLCGTNMCWHHRVRTNFSNVDGSSIYLPRPRQDDSEDWVVKYLDHPYSGNNGTNGVWKLREETIAFSRSTSSNHLHFSPMPEYEDFKKLFWLTRLYQQFFCNSPIKYDGHVLLSLRRAGLPSRGSAKWPGRGSYGNGYLLPGSRYGRGRENHNLTGNGLGTIEFRYNDLSKSPQTVLFYGYLATLAPHVPWEGLPKRVGFKDFDYQYRKFEPDMMAFTECIGDVAGRAKFWNAYTGDHTGWVEMVRSMAELEMGAFEKFTTITAWSDFWAQLLGSEIPPDTIIGEVGTGEPEVAASIEAFGGSHWDAAAAFNEAAGDEEAYI